MILTCKVDLSLVRAILPAGPTETEPVLHFYWGGLDW